MSIYVAARATFWDDEENQPKNGNISYGGAGSWNRSMRCAHDPEAPKNEKFDPMCKVMLWQKKIGGRIMPFEILRPAVDIMDDNIIPEGAARACQKRHQSNHRQALAGEDIGALPGRRRLAARCRGCTLTTIVLENTMLLSSPPEGARGPIRCSGGFLFWLMTGAGTNDYTLGTWVEYAHGIIEGQRFYCWV